MGADRRNPDGTKQLVVGARAPSEATKVRPVPPPSSQRVVPPALPVRPPPPPQRGKPASTAAKEFVAKASTPMPPLPTTVQQPAAVLPEPAAVLPEPAAVLPEPAAVLPEPAAAAAQQASSVVAMPASSAYTASPVEETPVGSLGTLDIAHEATPARRFRTKTIVGIAAGGVLGLVGAVLFSNRGVQAPPSTLAAAPTASVALAVAPPLKPAAVDDTLEADAPTAAVQAPATPSAAAEEAPQLATIPSSSFSAPSCQEILGSSFVEKVDAAAAFEQTQLGKRELVRANMDRAQQALCNAALWDGKNVERWLNLAQLFLIRRDGAKAAEAARMALALQPNNSRAFTAAGDGWAILGKVKEAREAYLAAETRSEPDAAALRLMIKRDMEEAYRTVKRHDFARAERVFRRVVVFDPQHTAASAGVATCLVKLGDAPLAEAWQRRAEMLRTAGESQ